MGDLDVNTPIRFCTESINMSKVASIKHKINIKTTDKAGDVSKEKLELAYQNIMIRKTKSS